MPLLCHMAKSNQANELSRAVAGSGAPGLRCLLQPGKRACAKNNNHPFHMEDAPFVSALLMHNAALIAG